MMNISRFVARATVTALLLGVAVGRAVAQGPAPAGTAQPLYSELVEYTWPDQHVTVDFDRISPHSAWGVYLRDSQYAIKQADQPGKTWGREAGRCGREECLKFLDEALTRFEAAKPGSSFSEFNMEMQVDRDLWRQVLTVMRKALSDVKGYDHGGPFYPDRVIEAIIKQERASQTIKDITALLAKHGWVAHDFGFASGPSLRPSLAGDAWKGIASLPDAGVDVPPVLCADVSRKR